MNVSELKIVIGRYLLVLTIVGIILTRIDTATAHHERTVEIFSIEGTQGCSILNTILDHSYGRIMLPLNPSPVVGTIFITVETLLWIEGDSNIESGVLVFELDHVSLCFL